MIYRIKFRLSDQVNNLEEAQSYLSSDDLTTYLIDDVEDRLKSVITKIEWIQDTDISGYVELRTNDYLNEEDLDWIRDWVDGQNSDGLGSGYSEQDFANYETTSIREIENEYEDDSILETVYEQISCSIELDGDIELIHQ